MLSIRNNKTKCHEAAQKISEGAMVALDTEDRVALIQPLIETKGLQEFLESTGSHKFVLVEKAKKAIDISERNRTFVLASKHVAQSTECFVAQWTDGCSIEVARRDSIASFLVEA